MYSNGDVADNEINGFIKDTKIKTSWEWNIYFSLNEKVHLWNSRAMICQKINFLAEITFKLNKIFISTLIVQFYFNLFMTGFSNPNRLRKMSSSLWKRISQSSLDMNFYVWLMIRIFLYFSYTFNWNELYIWQHIVMQHTHLVHMASALVCYVNAFSTNIEFVWLYSKSKHNTEDRSKVKFSKENSPRPKFQLYYNNLQKEQEVGNDFTICLLNLIPKVTTPTRCVAIGLVKLEI